MTKIHVMLGSEMNIYRVKEGHGEVVARINAAKTEGWAMMTFTDPSDKPISFMVEHIYFISQSNR